MANFKIVQKLLGEMTASFIFGFVVYSATISTVLQKINGAPILAGLAIAFSAVVIIYVFVEISPAHFNPAITLSTIVFRKIPILTGFACILFQLIGFIIAAAVILGCFPGKNDFLLDTILPSPITDDVTTGELICIEMFLTGILVYVVFAIAANKYFPEKDEDFFDRSIVAPLIIGLTIGFLAFLGGSTSGGVFNPGLVFAPVLLTGDWSNSWKYWISQFVGGLVGASIHVFLLKKIKE